MRLPGKKGARSRDARHPVRRVVVRVLAVVAVLAVFAAVPFFVNTAIGFAPIVAAPVLLALCFAYLLVLKRCLSFAEEGPDQACIRGDVLKFALTVRNRSVLPAPRLEVRFYISDAFGGEGQTMRRILTLPPRSSKTFDLGVRFDHIGDYEVGIERVCVFEPLGLFFSERHNGEMHPIVIEPRTVAIAGLELSEEASRESVTNVKTFISDGMDYSGVREYRWGDPIKSIHWKLSSKMNNTYLTRLYEMPTVPGVAVFCDLECTADDPAVLMDVYDAVVECALSVVGQAAANGFEAELLFVDDLGEPRRFTGSPEGYRAKALEALPLIHAGSGDAARDLLHRESTSIYCQHNVVMCTANADEAMANCLIGALAARRNPLLVAVEAGTAADSGGAAPTREGQASDARATMRRLSALGIWSRVVKSADDLKAGA